MRRSPKDNELEPLDPEARQLLDSAGVAQPPTGAHQRALKRAKTALKDGEISARASQRGRHRQRPAK